MIDYPIEIPEDYDPSTPIDSYEMYEALEDIQFSMQEDDQLSEEGKDFLAKLTQQINLYQQAVGLDKDDGGTLSELTHMTQ